MPNSFKLSRRVARLRAPLLGILVLAMACDSTKSLDPTTTLPVTQDESGVEIVAVGEQETTASASFSGGIPLGMTAQPLTVFGSRFNGGKRTVGPNQIKSELSAIRSRGGRVVVMLAGNPRHYQDGDNHFSFTKWKSRVDQFKNIDFGSYIQDGTIIGHYLMDEPNDPRNWGGRPVPASMVEEMAKHSKQLWPGMATLIRTQPDYLSHNHRYLDAAWATYLHRRGNVNDYIRKMVSEAQDRGLQLVVGLNVLRGGNPNGSRMSASEVESWGSALLSSSYPCAFLMWEYSNDYLSSSGMGNAMDELRRKAQNRSSKSCRS
jgi:hypothetical protein